MYRSPKVKSNYTASANQDCIHRAQMEKKGISKEPTHVSTETKTPRERPLDDKNQERRSLISFYDADSNILKSVLKNCREKKIYKTVWEDKQSYHPPADDDIEHSPSAVFFAEKEKIFPFLPLSRVQEEMNPHLSVVIEKALCDCVDESSMMKAKPDKGRQKSNLNAVNRAV